jgi:hypothetical protein
MSNGSNLEIAVLEQDVLLDPASAAARASGSQANSRALRFRSFRALSVIFTRFFSNVFSVPERISSDWYTTHFWAIPATSTSLEIQQLFGFTPGRGYPADPEHVCTNTFQVLFSKEGRIGDMIHFMLEFEIFTKCLDDREECLFI